MLPAEAKAQIAAVLDDPEVFSDRRFIRSDLIDLRRDFANDDDGYAEALTQTALEITRAMHDLHSHGSDLEHDLAGWRRSKYPSKRGGPANMRLVFRPRAAGIEILVLAHRQGIDADGQPTTAYFAAAKHVVP